MGRTIEQIAISRGHQVVMKIDDTNVSELNATNLKNVDVAIEFTRPEAAFKNIAICIENNVPIVSGTTGWLEELSSVEQLVKTHNGCFFYASNYSVGVNIFFEVNRYLAKMMETQKDYQISMEEIHHTQKLDAPSGTAITLAEGIMENIKRKTQWINEKSLNPEELGIISKRVEDVPGTHTIFYDSAIDSIEIKHTAHNRQGFATGAVLAAEYVLDKKGMHGMKDLLGF